MKKVKVLLLMALLLTMTACGNGTLSDNSALQPEVEQQTASDQETASGSAEAGESLSDITKKNDISVPAQGLSYRDVVGYREGFVAVGDAGKAMYVDFSKRITTVDTGVQVNLTCIKRWGDGLIVGGANGTILKSNQGLSFDSMKLGDDDIVGIDVFNGKIYAISRGGILYTSESGVDWISSDTMLDDVIGIAANKNCLTAASEEGVLWIATENGSRSMDYNVAYGGYGHKITVKGIASDGDLIWLLSENAAGEPMGIFSNTGEVWQERPFRAYDDAGNLIETNIQPLALIYNDVADQRLILSKNGRILTVTSCEECDKLNDLNTGDLLAGDFWYGSICVIGEDEFLYIADFTALRQDMIAGKQAAVEVENGGILVDVNSKSSYAQRHVKGAANITLDELREKLPVLVPDRNTVVIFYCTAGRKSQMALEIAQELGYTRAYSMGGLDNWPYEFETGE